MVSIPVVVVVVDRDAEQLEAPARAETFLDEGRGGSGWGTEETGHWSGMGLGALTSGGGSGGSKDAGNTPLPIATRGTAGERLLGSLTPVLVSSSSSSTELPGCAE